jgi:hypothetical protein
MLSFLQDQVHIGDTALHDNFYAVPCSSMLFHAMPDGHSYCLDICIPDAVTDPAKFLVLFRSSALAQEESGGDENTARMKSRSCYVHHCPMCT